MAENTLPPLPPSDNESLTKNRFDGYYQVRSRDFWELNAVSSFAVIEPKKCDHEFCPHEGGAICTKCHFGLLGQFEIYDRKLFYKGEPIKFNV